MRYFESYYKTLLTKNDTHKKLDSIMELMDFDNHSFSKVLIFDETWICSSKLDKRFIDSLIDITPYAHASDDYKNNRFHAHSFTLGTNKYIISLNNNNMYFVDNYDSVREMRFDELMNFLTSLHSLKLFKEESNKNQK